MRAVSTDWANVDDAANVAAKATAIGKARDLFVMGTSSGLIFLIDSHCIGGPRRSIVLDAIDGVRRPLNLDFVFIKSPPYPPHLLRRFSRVFISFATPPTCCLFVASS